MSGIVLENTTKRDTLVEIEKKYQKKWAEDKVFEVDAPGLDEFPAEMEGPEVRSHIPKFFSTMAYPYMNGTLHIGHGFTLSKVDYAVGFERMNFKEGQPPKRGLFPLGFHCTGMPIKSAADKIVRELEMFGQDLEKFNEDEEAGSQTEEKAKAKSEDVTKFKSGKAKAAQKSGKAKYQFQIMEKAGISRSEIKNFADPEYWLYYFSPLCQKHVTMFGARVDWRRSTITTDINGYYDSFVRWQINRLRDLGKIKFGERYTVYSEKDGQACMDHDRQSGEGLGPQEYTGIKIELLEIPEKVQSLFKSEKFDATGKKIYLVAATLRPETMYGQTACFVSPKIDYGLFDAGNNEYFITTQRAFRNMSFQKLTPKRAYYEPVLTLNGSLLVGAPIKAPLAIHKKLFVLPMETILPTKGTGVVTCVPSDSPDDFINMRDLQNKPEFYKIEKEWADVELVPVIHTEKYGDVCAEKLCTDLKIQSPKDANQLAKAKEAAYKEGYFNGTMVIGKYKGEKVEVAKPKVKADLCATGEAFTYCEPEGVVISRSGDDCIVSLEDQWYLDYGEENWKQQALLALKSMNTFSPEVENAFEGVLNWLKNWSLTKAYGLGSKLPWDDSLLVESLSDSTIYHSYYTISHLLHSDFYGKVKGPLGIDAKDMTDDVWDYIMLRKEDIKTEIPFDKLNVLRREFEYFYPLDMSVSGKDLIPNHLTFFIYVNTAIFPKAKWPAGIRANGHLLLNNNKMSKSTGNFYTVEQITEKFGADAVRIALADAGDTMEDANFEEKNASAAILRLYTYKEWSEDVVKNKASFRSGPIKDFLDLAFENEMNVIVEEAYKQYSVTNFKFALKAALFDFQTARDYYVDACGGLQNAHVDLLLRYIEQQALMLAPIAPHIAEYINIEVLGNKTTVHSTPFPRANKPLDQSLTDALEYVRTLSRTIREAEFAATKTKKGKAPAVDASKPVVLDIFVAETFPDWQERYIELVRQLFEQQTLNDNKVVKSKVDPKEMKKAMPFISVLKSRLTKEKPESVFNRGLSFDELSTIKSVLPVIKKSSAKVNISKINLYVYKNGEETTKNVETGEVIPMPKVKSTENAVPGEPGIILSN